MAVKGVTQLIIKKVSSQYCFDKHRITKKVVCLFLMSSMQGIEARDGIVHQNGSMHTDHLHKDKSSSSQEKQPFVAHHHNFQSKTIVIDPGHGGVYFGCTSINRKLIEKNVVLDIAQMLAKRLRKKGFNVILTRTRDCELDKTDLIRDLTKRAELTRAYDADIFVSIHLNNSANKGLRGYEIYVPYESKYPRRSYDLANALHYELSHKIKPIFGGGILHNHNNVDHGIRAAKFNVLIKSSCPAVAVELDYLSNAETEKMLSTHKYKAQLANAVYCGIRRYFEKK